MKVLKRALVTLILLILIMAVYLGLHSMYILPFWVTTLKAIAMITVLYWGLGWLGKRKKV